MFLSFQRLTKDGDGRPAGSDRSAHDVGDGALIGAAVLRGGSWDAEDVDDPIRKSLFHLNRLHSLRTETEIMGLLPTGVKQICVIQHCP